VPIRPQTARFAELLQGDEDSLPLDEAALHIAAHAYPGLDVAGELGRLDDLAARCPGDELDVLLEYLFGECGFTGNRLEYYDPRNSFLNEVVRRRLGIPITLAVVAIEVGRRVGLPLLGVGMPGHFLVRYGPVLVDPFTGGRRLSEDDCRQLLAPTGAELDPSYLAPVGPRAIVTRMLANLRQVYLQAGDARSLEWVVALRTAVPGVDPAELGQLARLRVNLGMFAEAADALERLAAVSALTDAAQAQRLEARARLLRARLN
jgi:regulator of sirC expression with transglutaminase-like and TPR domain